MRITSSAAAIASAVLLAVGCQSTSTASHATSQPTTKPDKVARAPKGVMEHRRDAFDADTLKDGSFHHTTYVGDGASIELREPREDFPFTGQWTSPTMGTEFRFTELLPSWNAIVPDNTGVRFEVRTHDAETKQWSPWLYIGYWGRTLRDHTQTSFDGGKVDTDTLELEHPADSYEIRVQLMDFKTQPPSATPTVRHIDVVYSRPMPEKLKDRLEPRDFAATKPATQPSTRPLMSVPPLPAAPKAKTPKKGPTTIPASIDIAVPYRAQGWEGESLRHSICSPTSVSMVMEWAGQTVATETCAVAIWDDDNAMFGNWNRAVQLAGSLGLNAHLERFSSMDEARALLSTGQPIIASIRFKPGTFPSNVQNATAGHLIVLRGYDEHGDIIVNDPASKDHGNGVIYKSDELANAWLVSTGGVGYVIEKKTK